MNKDGKKIGTYERGYQFGAGNAVMGIFSVVALILLIAGAALSQITDGTYRNSEFSFAIFFPFLIYSLALLLLGYAIRRFFQLKESQVELLEMLVEQKYIGTIVDQEPLLNEEH